MLLLGIDFGTTNWKVVAYNLEGEVVAAENRRGIIHKEKEGRATYKPDEVWNYIAELINNIVKKVGNKERISAIGTASLGEAGLFIDDSGKPLHNALAWFDPRTKPQAEWWRENIGEEKVYEHTGFPVQHIGSINKMMWIKENWPEIYDQADNWLCMNNYINYCLTGIAAIDNSMASRTMAFDLDEGDWSRELVDYSGLDINKFPRVLPGSEVIGTVTAEAAKKTGLSTDTKVVCGGYDHLCGSLAVGCITPGLVLDSSGTSEVLLMATDNPIRKGELLDKAIATGAQAVTDSFYLAGILPASGAVVEWLRELLIDNDKYNSQEELYNHIIKEAKSVSPGSEGLLILPHLRGSVTPVNDAYSRAAIVGARSYHKKGHFFRAAFESLGYELKLNLETLENSGIKIEKMLATGGAVENELWFQIKADITGYPFEIPDLYQHTCLGAAMLGGIGIGAYKDEQEAIDKVYKKKKIIEPDDSLYDKYHGIYLNHYKQLYSTLADYHQNISADFSN